jgi:prolyl oligopeptidase
MTDSVGSGRRSGQKRGGARNRVSPATGVVALIALLAATVGLAGCSAALRLAPAAYPRTPTVPVVDDYHGTRVADPYRWLEALDSPQVADWVARQNRLTIPFLAALPHRAPLQARLTELYRYERFGVPTEAGGRYFFLRNDGQQNQAALHVSASPDDLGLRLIDPDTISGDATVSLADYVPSPDGSLLAYALSESGSDWKTWHVRDTSSGVDRADLLRETKFTVVSWARDSSGFYYSRYPAGDDQRQPVIHFHRLGDPQEQDAKVFAVTDSASRVPDGTVTRDGRYLVIVLDEGTVVNAVSAMALDGTRAVQPVFADAVGYSVYLGSRQGVGTELLFRTTRGAARGQILAVDLGRPAGSRERVVVPEAAEVIEAAALVGGVVTVTYLKDAHAQLRRVDAASGRLLGDVALPGLGSVAGFTGDDASSATYFSYSDFFTPTRIYRLEPRSGATTLLRSPAIAADLTPYETEQLFFTSRDGTRVPLFLVHRRDMKRDGRNPVMLYGYGGFDISETPAFSAATLAWLEMGGVYAVANLRGGGEYGSAWHLAGTRERKQNVFDDFIAAAQFLVKSRVTVPGRLVIRGGSNGGLLVGAVLTQRPELFGAALPDVGVLDMLRYHRASANARLWADDYGVSENEADFRAQLAYSPYHNAGRRHCYPPTLVTTAAQDNRVVPWHSFKFTAALQAAQRCGAPTLIRVETRAGHGAGRPVWMQVEQVADQWAFAAAALRMPPPLPRGQASPSR